MSQLVAPPPTGCLECGTSSHAAHEQHQSASTRGLNGTQSPSETSMLARGHPVDGPVPRTSEDASYLRDVLRLPDGTTEEQLDEELRGQARLLGVDTDALAPHEQPRPRSAAVPEATRKSQESDTSKASQSTGLASSYSDISREQAHVNGRARCRTSLSLRDYDAFLARGAPSGRQSMSFTPPATPSQSTFSLPLLSSPESSPRRHFRRIKGLSMLRLGRAESSTSLNNVCPHCPQDVASQRRAMHKMPCGHKLCIKGLRNTINAAAESETGAVPSCCGRPIPGNLVEHVMTQTEQTASLEKMEHWDEAASVAPSATSGRRASTISHGPVGRVPDGHPVTTEAQKDAAAPQLLHNLDETLERPEFKTLRQDEADQRERLTIWFDQQRAALASHHASLMQQLKSLHEVAIEELLEVQTTASDQAEDKQVNAEADMRHFHSQRVRDHDTALKHMEAFCAGTYRTGESHKRTVTEQDIAELDKARRTRGRMDAKHDSAINVLRGEQSRRMKFRAQRQECEARDLRRRQGNEEAGLERACALELRQLEGGVAEKRRGMRARWQMRTAIAVKGLEVEAAAGLRGRGTGIEWQAPCLPDSATLPGLGEHDDGKDGHSGISTGFAMRGDALAG
ncbi:hypothetical protein LTR08_004035 [Meristemomyces frigidus]|nr:hypothetical protein LTR08_004035 [Meristemomyces frigidus]